MFQILPIVKGFDVHLTKVNWNKIVLVYEKYTTLDSIIQ